MTISKSDDLQHQPVDPRSRQMLLGLRVLEVEPSDAASYCTRLLASIGAEVVKVERRQGDPARRSGPFRPGSVALESGAKHLWFNAGKQSLCLDYETPAGRDLLSALAARADIVVHSLTEACAAASGLGFLNDSGAEGGPLVVQMTPFGSTGAYAEYEATHLVEQALSGYMYHNGEPGEMPLMGAGLHEQQIAGLYGFIGIMASLLGKDSETPVGAIEIASMECMVSMHYDTVPMYVGTGTIRPRLGNRYPDGHPLTIWECKDGYVAIAVVRQPQWELFCAQIARQDLLEDERFVSSMTRSVHWQELDREVRPWLMQRTRAEIFSDCQKMRVPCAPVWDVREILENEHLAERGYWQPVANDGVGTLQYPWPPIRLTDGSMQVGAGPRLGEQTELVLREWLGADSVLLERLVAEEVLY